MFAGCFVFFTHLVPWVTAAGVGYACLTVLYTTVRVIETVTKKVYNGPFAGWEAPSIENAYENSAIYELQTFSWPTFGYEALVCLGKTGKFTHTKEHAKYGC